MSLPLCLTLLSCGDPPPAPDLLGHPISKAERIILDDSIDAADIRQIFDAVNEDGRLNTLAPWIHQSSDAELNTLGDIVTRYIYQPAQDTTGLVAVLHERIERKSFSAGREASREFSRQADAGAISELVETVLRSDRFTDIVERDIGFLAPELDESIEDLHLEFEKAFGAFQAKSCTLDMPITSAQIVDDIQRFLANNKVRQRFINLSDSLSDSWPVVGLLHSIRQVNKNHGGKAFEGMGEGLAHMIRDLRWPETKKPPTQFDAMMDLFLALEGPSDGLFLSLQEKLMNSPDIARELGTILQPNVNPRFAPYIPYLPNTATALLVNQLEAAGHPLAKDGWLALSEPAHAKRTEAQTQFFISARTAHENLIGPPKEIDSDEYLIFNLPMYLNSYALTLWVKHALEENRAKLAALPATGTARALLDTKVSVTPFEYSLTTLDPMGARVFDPAQLKAIDIFGLDEFAGVLRKHDPAGLGGFSYSVPELKDIPFRAAIQKTMEALDATRGYADGSAVVRSAISTLTRRGSSGKSMLEGMETPNVLLSTHRMLASMPSDSWKQISSVLFDGMKAGDWNEETKKTVLELFTENTSLQSRVSRVMDSLGVVKELDSPSKSGISAFEAYTEILRESGPREWRALSDGLLFFADSRLFSLGMEPDGSLTPLFPSAHSFLSEGNASGLLRLASEIQPSRHRALADFIHEMTRLRNGLRGSELHWDFLNELVTVSPSGVKAFLDSFRGGSLSNARERLTLDERKWIVAFVRDGAFRQAWEILGPLLKKGSPSQWVQELRHFSEDGTLASTFRLMGQVKNERIKAIAKVLQQWDSTGELAAFLETLEKFLGPRPAAPST